MEALEPLSRLSSLHFFALVLVLAPISLFHCLFLTVISLPLTHTVSLFASVCVCILVYECHIYVILHVAYALPLHVIVHSECNAAAAAAADAAMGNNFQLLCAYTEPK